MTNTQVLLLQKEQVAAICFFMVVSIGAVLANKALYMTYAFPYPIFATGFQFGISLIIMGLLHVVGKRVAMLAFYNDITLNFQVALEVLPVSVVFLCMILFNNVFLVSANLSMYTIGKAMAIPFSVMLSFLVFSTRISLSVLLACVVVAAGVVCGSLSSNVAHQLDAQGLVLGGLCSFFTAGYQVSVQRALQRLGGDKWKLAFYNAFWCFLLLMPISLITGELNEAMVVLFPSNTLALDLFAVLCLSGVVGFLIAIATYVSIHATSALTHHVTGSVKAVGQSVIGVLLFHDEMTWNRNVGLVLTLAGAFMYMQAKQQQKQQKDQPQQAVEPKV